MSNNNKTPAIRFKGFTDTWEQRKLGDMCDEFQSGKSIKASDITDSGEYAVYGGNGFRGYTDTYNHDGDYALIGRQGALCGNMNFSSGKAYFTEHAVAVHGNADNDTLFLYYLLDLMNLGQYSGQSAQPGLAVNKIIQLKTKAPKLDEQRLISSFFKQLDTLITLHQRKYDKLIQFKAAMLQKMFPKNGANKPEIRFRGFTDGWEQRKLSDTLNFLSNNTLSRAELSEDTGTYKNVHYGDVLIKFGEYIDAQSTDLPYIADDEKAKKFESSKLQDGDIIIVDTAEDEAVGKCVEIGNIGDLSIVSGLHTIPCRPKVKFAPAYLGFYLNSSSYHDQLIPLMQGIKVTSISKSAISDTLISAQTDLSEQGKIGQFFSQLDTLITLHQRKCDKYKSIKSGLIRKLFP